MDSSTCFNVTFDSADCTDIFPDNKTANFRIRLPRTVHLNSSWRVGLADVTFTNSRFTFDRPEVIDVVIPAEEHLTSVAIQPALFSSIEQLVLEINERITQEVSTEHVPRVLYKDGRIRIQEGRLKSIDGDSPVALQFGPGLKKILGIDRWGIPSLNARQPIVFIYCSLVKQRVVGDITAKLLRTVDPSRGRKFGSVVSQVFKRIYFCELDTYDFNEIEIQLRDDVGAEPLFKAGSFRVTLQFRQEV
jgi:hypothetical protein